jgi:hypothetical protein
MAVSRSTRKLVGALGFVALGSAAVAVGMETLAGAVLSGLCIASWLLFAHAALAGHAENAARAPRELRGVARAKVARAILASWYIPGTGQLLLGWSRSRAAVFAVPFLAVAGLTITGVIPVWAGIVLGTLPWLTSHVELHRRTGWPLLRVPHVRDLFPPEPNEPSAFAPRDELAADDPRRDWRGR